MRITILIVLAGLFFSCGNANTTDASATAETETKTATKMVSQKVSAAQFQQLLAKSPDAQLIDVRTPAEYEAGTIEKAVNINIMDADFANQIDKLDKNRPVFLFCKVGGRSARAATQLEEMGFTTIYDMTDGYLGWEKLKEQPTLDVEQAAQ